MALLGELEQKVMSVLWNARRPLKPAEVQNRLNWSLAYTTVMTVLKRLSDKGILGRKKQGKVYFYFPRLEKGDYVSTKLNDLFENIINTYGHLAISQFVDNLKENPSDLEILRRYLDKHGT
jgi:predicted transcriptional regulator